MKRLLIGVALLGSVVAAQAGPYNVYDPQDAIVTAYNVSIDGGASKIIAATPATGGAVPQVYLRLDLGPLSLGPHTIVARSITVWGESDPVNFTFTKLASPVPQNPKIVP